MRKDRITDYATAAFKDYAKLGGQTSKTYADKRYNFAALTAAENIGVDAPKNNVGAAIAAAERQKEENAPLLADMAAVEHTFERLKNKQHIIDAVKAVYMTEPFRPLSQREIGRRVINFAVNYPADVRTVYKWLKQARQLFAYYRGLYPGENGQ